MKFEAFHAVSEGAGADTPAPPTARFTLDQAAFAGQSFSVTFRVCPNPCCPCGVVGLECRPEAGPGQPLTFDLEVFERQLNTRVQSAPDAVALRRAFVAEAQPADWQWLGQLFLTAKRRQMETMDLDTLAVDLPADVKAGGSTMVGYRELFPWAETLRFSRNSEEWYADDQHCVQPGCRCTETGLAFFRLPKGGTGPAEPLRCVTFLFHDHATGKTRPVEAQPGSPAPDALVQALRAAHPQLAETLRHRHGQLQQLGRRLLRKTRRRSRRSLSYLLGDDPEVDDPVPAAPTPSPVRSTEPGRNDPCPCGSGKKFKKCCGAA